MPQTPTIPDSSKSLKSTVGRNSESPVDMSAVFWQKEATFENEIFCNEQNVSVMYIDINAISLYFDLNIFQQDECFCSKLGMVGEYAKSNLKTSLSQILATRDMQFGQELALVMQTTHAQRWQYPDVSTRVCFLPLKMYTGYYKNPWVWV